MKKIAFCWALFVLLFIPMLTSADYNKGIAALKHGDYTIAYQQFLLAAKQGEVIAQVFLGLMYSQGQGVPQDYEQAHKWLLNEGGLHK